MVQCGSCGNKWKQFPLDKTKKIQPIDKKIRSKTPKKNLQRKTKKAKKKVLQKNSRN